MLAVPAFTASVHAQERPHLRVHVTTAEIHIDGRLAEPAWQRADSIANLTQTEPIEGAQPTGRTVVRVLATTDQLIIGVRAFDPDAAHITSYTRGRDADLTTEDHVRIVLDTYMDGRSGYVFIINPSAARYDALINRQGEGENANWDAVWEAATTRDSLGWSAEVRVPAKSLLFRPGLSSWGFNVQRRIQRLLEHDRWATPQRDTKINMTSRAGILDDIPPFELGLGLSVRPAAKASAGIPAPTSDVTSRGDWALDVTQRLGANTLSSLTVNTDFAETQVDTRRTNLTRFPLLFPEKRTFFLEGSDIFDFGFGTGDDLRAFFSRRIGLLDGGGTVPLDVGAKVNGRHAGTSYGALVTRTRNLDTLPTGNTMGVIRVRQNVLGESSMGVIGSFGDPLGRPDSWTAGSDFTYQTTHFRGDKNLLLSAWGLRMDRQNLGGRRYATGAAMDFPNDLFDIALNYKMIGDGFDPSLGFVPRRGVQLANSYVAFQPRPSRPILGLHVRQMFEEWEQQIVTDLDGKWQSYEEFFAPVNWRLESGDRFEFNYVPMGERLVEPFEIANGVVIPEGTYHWTRWRAEAGFAAKRAINGQLTWWFGEFYSGRLDQFQLISSWRVSPLFVVELNGEHNEARLAEGNFTQQVIGTRLSFSFSPDLQANSYLQYDNETGTFGTNTRLRWTFTPQGDLFVVYNHNAFDPSDVLDPTRRLGWRFESNQLLVKVQYAFLY